MEFIWNLESGPWNFPHQRGTSLIRTLIFILALATAAAAGWFAARSLSAKPDATASAGRRVLFYQSPMHPWIKSDQPGDCTICGMKLVPVFEGDAVADSAANLVTLSAQSIAVLHVESAPVKRQPLLRSLHVAGRIDDDDSTHRRLSATVDGRIEKLFVPSVGTEARPPP